MPRAALHPLCAAPSTPPHTHAARRAPPAEAVHSPIAVSACDENDYEPFGRESACTQREDGQRYDSLTGLDACAVDPTMQMTAETWATWAPGPLECTPGTVTEKCCWWGRGAIHTTGNAVLLNPLPFLVSVRVTCCVTCRGTCRGTCCHMASRCSCGCFRPKQLRQSSEGGDREGAQPEQH